MTAMQRRAADGTDAPARAALIAAVRRLLAGEGVGALTSRAISDAAGTNLALITYYFGSKDQLVAEAMVATAEELLEPVVAALGATDPVTGLFAAAQQLQKMVDANRGELAPYIHCLAAATGGGAVRNRYSELHQSVCGLLARIIAEQRTSGSLPEWIVPEPMAQLIVALVNGVAVGSAIDPEGTDPAAIAGQLIGLLLAVRQP